MTRSKIVHVSDWHSRDELDHRPVLENEALRVKFPDRSLLDVFARVYRGPEVRTGACDTCSESYSYAEVTYRGAKAEVRLAGLEAERLEEEVFRDPDKQEFAKLIRASRYTDDELAQALELNPQTIYRWRIGKQRPWPAMRHVVAEWLAEHPKPSLP